MSKGVTKGIISNSNTTSRTKPIIHGASDGEC